MAAMMLTVQFNEKYFTTVHCIIKKNPITNSFHKKLNFGIKCKSIYTWVNELFGRKTAESTALEWFSLKMLGTEIVQTR